MIINSQALNLRKGNVLRHERLKDEGTGQPTTVTVVKEAYFPDGKPWEWKVRVAMATEEGTLEFEVSYLTAHDWSVGAPQEPKKPAPLPSGRRVIIHRGY